MQKLKEDKKIKWEEAYTPKTEFLKNQFEATVGRKSYTRWEGNEIGGPGKWYVVVSPADVHEHKRAKFFAGVRKLPDSYPAGGKYFDTIREAYEYAFDTWGTPKLANIPYYTSGDLKGISSRIEKWKKKKEEQEDKDKKKANLIFDIFRIRTSMGKGTIKKDSLNFDLSFFIPLLESINITDANAADEFYRELIRAAGYSGRQEIETELLNNANLYGRNYAKTKMTNKYIPWDRDNWGLAQPPGADYIADQLTAYKFAAKICTIGRMQRERVIRDLYNIVGSLSQSEKLSNLDKRFFRSNFEDTILSSYQRFLKNKKNLKQCYEFYHFSYNKFMEQNPSSHITYEEFKSLVDRKDRSVEPFIVKDSDYPIKIISTYSRRDSSCGIWIAAPYISDRKWDHRVTIPGEAITKDEYGFSQIDYAIILGLGYKREKVDGVEQPFNEQSLNEIRSTFQLLGDIPKKISEYIKHGRISKSEVSPKNILGNPLSSRELSIVKNYILNSILSDLPSEFNKTNIINAIVTKFSGWLMFNKGVATQQKERQEILARQYGSFYIGKKASLDKVSSKSVVEVLQGEVDVFVSDKTASPLSIITILSKLKDYSKINTEEKDKLSNLVSQLSEIANNNQEVSVDQFRSLVESNDLSQKIRRDDILYIFSESVSSGLAIPKKGFVSSKIIKTFSASNSGLMHKYKINRNASDQAMESMSDKQKALIYYIRRRGWTDIESDLYSIQGDLIPRITFTRILRDQVENISRDSENPEYIRIFTDEEIKSFLDSQKASVAQRDYSQYMNILSEGDVIPTVSKTADGVLCGSIIFSNYFYWKSMKNKIRNVWNVIETNPDLYEDILRTFFVPRGIGYEELESEIDSIGSPIFMSRSTNQQVNTDQHGNPLVFLDGQIKSVRRGRYIDPPNIDDLTVVNSQSSIQNVNQIESLLSNHFSVGQNKRQYSLHDSFFTTKLIPNVKRSSLTFERTRTGLPFSSVLSKLQDIQKKSLVEIAKDMVAAFNGGESVYQDESSQYANSPIYFSFMQELSAALAAKKALVNQEVYKAFERFSKSSGANLPYSVTSYYDAYKKQHSLSKSDDITSSLGYKVFSYDSSNNAHLANESFDIARNPSSYAISTNASFEEHCLRASLAEGAPSEFLLTQEEIGASSVRASMNSSDLSIALLSASAKEDVEQKINVYRQMFETVSHYRKQLETLVKQALNIRSGTPEVAYDPRLSTSKDANSSVLWYMATSDDYEQWPEEKVVLIVTNMLMNWVNGNLPDGNAMTPRVLFDILGGQKGGQNLINSINTIVDISTIINESTVQVENIANESAAEDLKNTMESDMGAEIETVESESSDFSDPIDSSEIESGAPETESTTLFIDSINEQESEGLPVEPEIEETGEGSPDISSTDESKIREEPQEAEPEKIKEPEKVENKNKISDEDDGIDIEDAIADINFFDIQSKYKSYKALLKVASIYIKKEQYAKAHTINNYIKDKIISSIDKKTEKQTIISTLSNLIALSKNFVKEGKLDEASEINLIVKKYIDYTK